MDDSANHDLVTEEYYKQELAYQKEIDASNTATELGATLKLEQSEDGITIFFPEKS